MPSCCRRPSLTGRLGVRVRLRSAYPYPSLNPTATQAPVSDREAASLEDDAPGRAANLARAQQLVAEGRPEALLPELHYGFVPINAARFCSLFGRGEI